MSSRRHPAADAAFRISAPHGDREYVLARSSAPRTCSGVTSTTSNLRMSRTAGRHSASERPSASQRRRAPVSADWSTSAEHERRPGRCALGRGTNSYPRPTLVTAAVELTTAVPGTIGLVIEVVTVPLGDATRDTACGSKARELPATSGSLPPSNECQIRTLR